MSALLRGARVFSNETENNASVKQEMTTNINVKLRPEAQNRAIPPPMNPVLSQPIYPTISDANFTQPTGQEFPPPTPHQNMNKTMEQSAYRSPQYNQPLIVPRSVNINEGLGAVEKNELESKVRVLEALLSIYESAPILIKGCLIISQKKLIEIIQILTGLEKVELLTDDFALGCCGGSSSSIVTVSKIFVVDGCGNRSEFKVAYNSEYSLLLRHGVNLKIVRVEFPVRNTSPKTFSLTVGANVVRFVLSALIHQIG
jgi:hypothetical protein